MIRVFGKTDTNFTSNGDIVLKPLKAKIRKEDNGDFYLTLETSLQYANYILAGNIVVANTPQGDQAFRIRTITKTRNKITVRADHVFYDTKNMLIVKTQIWDKTCDEALAALNAATEPQSNFTTYSDNLTENFYSCIRKSFYEGIQSVLVNWGGHLVRDNFRIEIRNSIGEDNGVVVQYRKNLKDITCEEKWDNVVTKLLPVGKDGIMLNVLDPSADIYIESTIQYEIPFVKTVMFDQSDYLEEEYGDEEEYLEALLEDLREQATEYLDNNCVPQVNYTLKANLEKITDIGDTIQVIDERLGLNLITNVISYTFDCILEQYTELEFGNFRETLSGLVGTITNKITQTVDTQVQNITSGITEQIQEATDTITDVLVGSYVVYDGDQILILDELPKEDAINVIKIDNDGISFSSGGIDGNFDIIWAIDGTLNMKNVNILNLVLDRINGGTLKIGGTSNINGIINITNNANKVIGELNKDGLKMYGLNGSYILINDIDGIVGYDGNDNRAYWWDGAQIHLGRVDIEEGAICKQLYITEVTVTNNNTVINAGMGIFALPD